MKVSIVLCPILEMEPQEKILKTALQMFFRYGIKHVTMDDIAKELGMSKKTIYQYYREKDDLVNQLCEVEITEKEKIFNDISKNASNPIEEIMMLSTQMKEMLQQINPIFFLDLQKFYPQAFNRFNKFKTDSSYQNVIDNLKKGIQMGVYRPDIDVDFVARYRLAQIDLLMFGNFYSYDKMSITRANEILLEMYVYGICTVKGHKMINNYKRINEDE